MGLARLFAAADGFLASLGGLTLATMGWVSVIPLVFVTTSDYLPKVSAAAGIALVSSLGNIGAAVGPPVAAWLTTRSGHPSSSMVFVIGCWTLAALVVLATIRRLKKVDEATRCSPVARAAIAFPRPCG